MQDPLFLPAPPQATTGAGVLCVWARWERVRTVTSSPLTDKLLRPATLALRHGNTSRWRRMLLRAPSSPHALLVGDPSAAAARDAACGLSPCDSKRVGMTTRQRSAVLECGLSVRLVALGAHRPGLCMSVWLERVACWLWELTGQDCMALAPTCPLHLASCDDSASASS